MVIVEGGDDSFHFLNYKSLTIDIASFKKSKLNCTLTASVERRHGRKFQLNSGSFGSSQTGTRKTGYIRRKNSETHFKRNVEHEYKNGPNTKTTSSNFTRGSGAPMSDINLKNIGCPFASFEEMDAFENTLLDADFFQKMVS